MLLTNEHSLLYNQKDCSAFFLRYKLKLLYKCCIFKVSQYILKLMDKKKLTISCLQVLAQCFLTKTFSTIKSIFP